MNESLTNELKLEEVNTHEEILQRGRNEQVHRLVFDNFVDFLAVAEKGQPLSVYTQSHKHEADDDWDFNQGWDGSLKLAHEGWPEGRHMVEELSFIVVETVIKSTEDVFQEKMHGDVAGSLVDVPKYLAGLPESMISFDPVYSPNKIIRIGVSTAFTWDMDAATIARRGAAIAALVDVLEMQRVRVEVVAQARVEAGYMTTKHNVASEWFVYVKRANSPLQMDQLAFTLAHPAMLRRIGFAVMENTLPTEWQSSIQGDGYGRLVDSNEGDELRGDVYIPAAIDKDDPKWATKESTALWIKDILMEQDIEIVSN